MIPTRGVDVGAKAELYRLIDGLVRQGIGVIMTSSELPELLTVCDRILVLSEGRLTASFTRAEATEQKIMEAATWALGKPANTFCRRCSWTIAYSAAPACGFRRCAWAR